MSILILSLSLNSTGCTKTKTNNNTDNPNIENKESKVETKVIDLGENLAEKYVSPYNDEEKGYFSIEGSVLENDIMYMSGTCRGTKVDFEGVMALNLKDNKIIWKTMIKEGVSSGSLTKYNDYLYVTSDKYFTCLNKNNGKIIFKEEIECDYVKPVVNNNILYIWGRIPPKFDSLYALNPDTGEELCSLEVRGHFDWSPTFFNNMIFFNTTEGSTFAIRVIEDTSSNYHFEILWSRIGENDQDPLVGSPVYWNENVYSQYHPAPYFIVNDRYLICYDALRGNEKWKLLLAHYVVDEQRTSPPYAYTVNLKYNDTEYKVDYQQPFLYEDQLYLFADKGLIVVDPLDGSIIKAINIDHELLDDTYTLHINENIAYWWYSNVDKYSMVCFFDLDKEMFDMEIKTPVDGSESAQLWVSNVFFKDNDIYIVSDAGIIFVVDKVLNKSVSAFRICGDLTIIDLIYSDT